MTAGVRSALVIASDEYSDPKLRQLRAPARDAEALAQVLRDPRIGDFEVEVVANEPEHIVRRKLAAFFQDRGLDDLLLLHLSCHGVKDDDGRLYFATVDTELAHLDATAIPSDFVNRQMTRSRSRRIVLLLDCCYSGAFASGLIARAGNGVDLRERFEGRGRVVLTASSAMEYAFEGGELSGAANPSVFTSALVRGLETGAADRNRDGWVSVDELYEYAFDEVRKTTSSQTPGKWTFDVQGDLYVAHSSLPAALRQADLPDELQSATKSPFAHVRAGAVEELAALARGPDPALARAARDALTTLVDDDSRRVSERAAEALGEASPAQPAPAEHADAVAASPLLTSTLLPSALALSAAVLVLVSFALPIADGDFVVAYLTRSVWDPLFVYSPIELVPIALVAAAVAFAALRGWIRGEFAGGIFLAGVLVLASAVALIRFFGHSAASDLVPIVAGTLLIVAGGLILTSSAGAAPTVRRDTLTIPLGIAGAVSIFISVFVDYEAGASLASVGTNYALEPLVAVASIAVALLLRVASARPLIVAGLLLAVGVQTALHDVGVIVASASGGSGLRAAGFVGLVGGALTAAAGARSYKASTAAVETTPL